MDYDNLCRSILQMDSKVRFAEICDISGEIKYGGQKEGVKNILTNEETRKSNLQALEGWGIEKVLISKNRKRKICNDRI
jgi:hypothetical protein